MKLDSLVWVGIKTKRLHMKKFVLGAIFALSAILFSTAYSAAGPSPQEAMKKLIEGNERFVKNHAEHPNQAPATRKELIKGQAPFAVIVSCSDSRVPPEIIFDQGLGDLFVVRCAGNVVGLLELDSVEFGANQLHAPLIVVMGHQNCGAVDATLQGKAKENDIENIAPFIEKAVEVAKKEQGDTLQNAIIANARLCAESLSKNPILKKLIDQGSLKIVPAYYSQTSGKVSYINQ
jgi:carbonic anhydrase